MSGPELRGTLALPAPIASCGHSCTGEEFAELSRSVRRSGLEITVCQFPPGTSAPPPWDLRHLAGVQGPWLARSG